MKILTSLAVVLLLSLSTLAEDKKPASDQPKISYDEQVRPILREHCFSCHNQDKSEGGLALDSYGALMEGGSSGEIVYAQDIDSSRLWDLIDHLDEPKMPPKQDKLPAPKLAMIKQWIELGALENSGSTVKKSNKPNLSMAASGSTGKPEGPAAMPEGLWRQPVMPTTKSAAVTAIACSPWAPLAAVAGQKQIALYNTDNGDLLGVLPFPQGIPFVLRFSRNGELLLAGGGRGGHSGSVSIYEVRTGKKVITVGDELDVVLAADISSDHALIALGGPQRIVRIYSTADGSMVSDIRKHTDWITSLEFSPDGVLLATADRSAGLFIWEAETAREYLNLTGHKGAIGSMSWRGDSNLLATASEDASVKLWEMNDGKVVKSFNAHGGGSLSVHYTHDGRMATAGRDKLVKIFDTEGKELKKFPAFADLALKSAFTHDGKRVVGGDWTGKVVLWNAEDAKPIVELSGNSPTYDQLIVQLTTASTQSKAVADQQLAAANTAEAAANAKNTQIQATAKKVVDLQAAITKGATDKQTAEQQKVAATALINQVPPKVAAHTAAAKVLEAEKTKLNAMADQLNKTAVASTKAVSEIGILAELIKKTTASVAATKNTAKTTTEAKAKADQEVKILGEELASAKQELEKTPDEEKPGLQKLVEDKTAQLIVAQAAVKTAIEVAAAANAKVAPLEKQLTEQQTSSQQKAAESTKLQADIKAQTAAKTAFEQQVTAKATALVKLKAELDQAQKLAATAKQQLAQLATSIPALQKQVEQNTAAMNAAKQLQPKLQAEYAAMMAALGKQKAAAAAAGQAATAAKAKADAAVAEKQAFAAQPQKLAEQAQAATTKSAEAKQAADLEKMKLTEMQQAMAAKQAAVDQAAKQLADIQAQLKLLQGQHAQVKAIVDAQSKTTSEKEAALTTIETELFEIQQQQQLLKEVYGK
ncbi:MAG: c-type cytochrome domain-containing protein [Pirellulales bacterium]